MKRILGALLLTLGLVAALPLQAADAAPGPDCATVDAAGGAYVTLEGPTLAVEYNLGAPACRQITYTVQALAPDGTELASSSTFAPNGDEVGSYRILVAVPTGYPAVCAVLTTSIGGKQFDYVPTSSDARCLDGGAYFELDGEGGASGMR